jgi:hypothetical protein
VRDVKVPLLDLKPHCPGHEIICEMRNGKLIHRGTGLLETFRWFLNNEAWWRGIMDGSYLRGIDPQYPRTTSLSMQSEPNS